MHMKTVEVGEARADVLQKRVEFGGYEFRAFGPDLCWRRWDLAEAHKTGELGPCWPPENNWKFLSDIQAIWAVGDELYVVTANGGIAKVVAWELSAKHEAFRLVKCKLVETLVEKLMP